MSKSNKPKTLKPVKQRIGKGENPEAEMVALREVNDTNVTSLDEYRKKSVSTKEAVREQAQDGNNEAQIHRIMPVGVRGAAMFAIHNLRRQGRADDADVLEFRYGISEDSNQRPHTAEQTAEHFGITFKDVMILDREVSKLYRQQENNKTEHGDIAYTLAHIHKQQEDNPDHMARLLSIIVQNVADELNEQGKHTEASALTYRHPTNGTSEKPKATIHETASKFDLSVKEVLALDKIVGRKLLNSLLGVQ
jgi:hypothetical protein